MIILTISFIPFGFLFRNLVAVRINNFFEVRGDDSSIWWSKQTLTLDLRTKHAAFTSFLISHGCNSSICKLDARRIEAITGNCVCSSCENRCVRHLKGSMFVLQILDSFCWENLRRRHRRVFSHCSHFRFVAMSD